MKFENKIKYNNNKNNNNKIIKIKKIYLTVYE